MAQSNLINKGCSSKFHDDFAHLPEHLTFDEFKGVGKKLQFICLDGDTHKVVQILRTRFKPNIFTILARKLSQWLRQ